MDIRKIDFDDEFASVFTKAGSPISECHCGREHVCIDSDALDDMEGQVIKSHCLQRAKDKEDQVFLHPNVDYISLLEVGGKVFVVECECEGWRP